MRHGSSIGMVLMAALFSGGTHRGMLHSPSVPERGGILPAGEKPRLKPPRPGSRSGWKWKSDTPENPTVYGRMALEAAAQRRARRAEKRLRARAA